MIIVGINPLAGLTVFSIGANQPHSFFTHLARGVHILLAITFINWDQQTSDPSHLL